MPSLVTVVIPVYNVCKYLERCVDSLLGQTYPHLELILVDDGSGDDSGEICSIYQGLDNRVRVITQPNGGLSAARNTGLRAATGDYIAFIDADDWVEFDFIERMHSKLTADSADVVVCGFWADFEVEDQLPLHRLERALPTIDVPPRKQDPCLSWHLPPELLNALGYTWNKMYARDVLVQNSLQFVEGLSLVEDVVFNADVFRHSLRVVTLEAGLVHYVQRPRVTLGTRYYPNYGQLSEMRTEALGSILQYWGYPSSVVSTSLVAVRASSVITGAQSIASNPDMGRRHQARSLARLSKDLDVHSIVASSSFSMLPIKQRCLLRMLDRDLCGPVLLLLRIRKRNR